METHVLFSAQSIDKTFGLTKALSGVDIQVKAGQIHGLIGENGSGKSTLASICAGMQKADAGTMMLDGKPYQPSDALSAMTLGVSMVVQEQGTIGEVSVAANIFIGKEDRFTRAGFMQVGKLNQAAQQELESIGITHIQAKLAANQYTFEDRKLIELARSLCNHPKLWIIDETTTALSVAGRDILYALMRRQCAQGGSVLFISHDIEEIMLMCDQLTVLRDGVMSATLDKSGFSEDAIKKLMIGREIEGSYYRKSEDDSYSSDVVLEMKNISTDVLKNLSLTLHKGEILGIGGLSECGIHDLGKVAFGLIRPDEGSVTVHGEISKNAAQSVKRGVAYVSKNRDKESMMLVCSIQNNICLPSLDKLSKVSLVSPAKEKEMANTWMQELQVKARNPAQSCDTLSGGNKQKVVLAKWLARGSDLLILDCPTRGIDIGTKAAIYSLIERLKDEGRSILLISEELPELIGMSDRLMILKDGEIAGEFRRSDGLTEAKLIEKMI